MRESSASRLADAALAIVTDEGPAAVTMRRVASAAGVTPMATYKHYANREALLHAVADAGFAELANAMHESETSTDFTIRLDGLLDRFLDFSLGKPLLYSFLVTERREDARRFPENFREEQSPAFSPVLRAVKLGIAQGVLRDDDPAEATIAITAQTQGLVQLYLGGRIGLSEHEFRQLCKRTANRTLAGLLTANRDAKPATLPTERT